MLKAILKFYDEASGAINRGVSLKRIMELPLKAEIGRMKEAKDVGLIKAMTDGIRPRIAALEAENEREDEGHQPRVEGVQYG